MDSLHLEYFDHENNTVPLSSSKELVKLSTCENIRSVTTNVCIFACEFDLRLKTDRHTERKDSINLIIRGHIDNKTIS